MFKRFLFFTMLVGLLLVGCTALPAESMSENTMADDAAMSDNMDMSGEMVEPTPGEITIVNVRARPAPMAGGTGAVYMTVLNGLEEDVQFVSAESPAANVVELHETVNDNGVMRMVPQPDGYPIPAGGSVELMPGGKHIMLIDLVAPLATGSEIELTLNFDNGESMTVTVPVVEMDGMPMNMDMGDEAMDGEGEMEMDATPAP
ncbi:MAG: copper chaperone PCu(A)C [Caldilineaceae bacterium]|nr:copper chaperone PCu(A)C [Caldilineaceae bacterium]